MRVQRATQEQRDISHHDVAVPSESTVDLRGVGSRHGLHIGAAELGALELLPKRKWLESGRCAAISAPQNDENKRNLTQWRWF